MAGTTTYYGITYPTSTDYVKDGASAIQTVATGFDSAVAIPTYNAQTGATYTFVLADTGKTVTANNASSQTYTIPPTASVAWTANTTLRVFNLGAGVVTFAAGAGVTVTNTAQTLTQYQSALLIRTSLDAWTIIPASGISSSGLTFIKAQTIGTTVASVNVTGAFSATYENYKIIVSGGVASTSSNLGFKLGSTTTGYYYGIAHVEFANGGLRTSNNGSNVASFDQIGRSSADGTTANIDLENPFTANKTMIRYSMLAPATTGSGGAGAGYLNNTTSYTDFTLTPASGTITGGTIRVYGYNN